MLVPNPTPPPPLLPPLCHYVTSPLGQGRSKGEGEAGRQVPLVIFPVTLMSYIWQIES